jgi:hypothetical protein
MSLTILTVILTIHLLPRVILCCTFFHYLHPPPFLSLSPHSVPSLLYGWQVSHLELLDAPRPKYGSKSFGPFTSVQTMIIHNGADDATLSAVGQSMVSLRRLELYKLPLGYTRTGVQALAGLPELRQLVLELSQSSGKSKGQQGVVSLVTAAAEGVEQFIGQIPGVGVMEGVVEMLPVVGQQAGARALSAFLPPGSTGLVGVANKAFGAVVGDVGVGQSRGWFPQLRELSLLGEVSANDADLLALSNLQRLEQVTVNAHQPRAGWGGGLTLTGVRDLVDKVESLMEVCITGGVHIDFKVPGRMPGIYGEYQL